jgi:MOSC domain-containing protein
VRPIGRVCEIVRYPVKSMAGTATESAILGWHGLAGDRRFAFRRLGDANGFPWLTASRLPQLILYHPVGLDESSGEPLPTHVRTPAGSRLELGSAELRAEIGERFGSGVDLMKLKHGIFDEATVSVISLATIAGIGREAGLDLDRRRFRANIVVETERSEPFLEDEWVGGMLVFGDGEPRPAVSVTLRDVRCMTVNLDPETGEQDARVMKTAVRLNQNTAGVYATVVRTGTIRVGDPVNLVSETPAIG